jgi:hypothetical protein
MAILKTHEQDITSPERLNAWDRCTIISTMHHKISIGEGINPASPFSLTRKIALTL